MSVLNEMKMGLRSLVDQHGPEVALCAKVVVKTLLPGGHFIAEGVEALCDYAAEQRQDMTEEGLFEVLGDLQRDQAHISALVKVLSERFEEVIDDLSVDVDLEAPREEHIINLTRQCERLLSRTTELEDVRREVVSWQPKFSSIQEQLRQQSDTLATHYDKLTSELGETRELLNTVAELTMSHYEPLSRDGLTSKQRITFSQAHSAFQEAYIATELAEMETSLEVMKGVDPYHPTFKICQLAYASLSGALDQLPQIMDTLPSPALQSELLQRLVELSSPQGSQEEPKEATPLTEEELREAELCLGEGGWELAPAKDQTEWALENLNAGWLLGARSHLRRGERWRVMSSEGASGSLQLFQGQLAKSGAFYERFDDELKRLSALNHPSIVKVLEWGRHEDKTPYVITEPLEGESLSERLARGYLSPEEMKSLGVKLTESLQACHEQGVLHRYIHPDHILLKGNGEAMLTHFGVTSPQGVDELMGVRRSDEYASPEQKQGRVVTSASDLYSLGVVLTNSVGGLKAVPRAWRPQIERMTSPFPSERPSAEEGHQLFNELTSSYYLCPPNEPSWGPLDADEVARWITDQIIKEALPPHFKLQQRGTLSAQSWRSFDEVERRVRSYLSQHLEERASQAQPAPSQTISSETLSSETLNSETVSSETSSASESVPSEPAQESKAPHPLSFEERVIPASPSAPSFLMMETQVTQALWEEVMGSNPSHFKGPQKPVEQVSWFDCVRFANALSLRKGLTPAYEGDPQAPKLVSGASGFRLPFEVEWEFAARGGQGCTFAGSNNLSEVGWYKDNSGHSTHDVAQLKPNAYGLYDMSGNVWEWCNDDYDNPGQHRPGADKRIRRGGSWLSNADGCAFAFRDRNSPDFRSRILGLRFSRPLPSKEGEPLEKAEPPHAKEPQPRIEVGSSFEPQTLLSSNGLLEELYEVGDVAFKLIQMPGQPFSIGQTQVTQALWEAVMGSNPSHFKGAQRPVELVSWEDSLKFANALSRKLGLTPAYSGDDNNARFVEGANGFRLPLEAEWVFAARGGEGFKFAGSDHLNEVGWYDGNSGDSTHDVGQLKANAYGLYDMSGNVWEWCNDQYENSEQHHLTTSLRVRRGGSWGNGVGLCKITSSYGCTPGNHFNYLGLRLSRSLD